MSKVYTVAQINSYIKNVLTEDFLLKKIAVSGEISNCKYNSMGHIYFTIKDEQAAISAIIFAGSRRNIKEELKDGMKVIVSGSIDVYEKGGSYSLIVKSLELAGTGDLYKIFMARKKELEEMGMFSQEYKSEIPRFATRIGIVTSPTGAAIHDISRVARRKNPYVSLYLYPAIVQGELAAASVAKGIRKLDKLGLDVIIIGRGGGSIEDLWAFNELEIAHTVFNAETPIISAVGHESDYTIADFVADKRAATPSMAADMASMDIEAFFEYLERYKTEFKGIIMDEIKSAKLLLDIKKRDIIINSPASKLKNYRNTLTMLKTKLHTGMYVNISRKKETVALCIERLKGLSPLDKLSSGYAFVTDKDYKRVDSVDSVSVSDKIRLNFADGSLIAKVTDKFEK